MAAAPSATDTRALADEGLLERVRPFALAALIGVAAAFALPRSVELLVVGLALTLAAIGAALFVQWRRLPAWTEVTVPILYLAGLGYLRLGAGGVESGMSVLVLLPIVWAALYGGRRDLFVVVGAAAATIILPIVLVGPPMFPESEWRRALLLAAIGAMVGLTVQQLVAQVRSHSAEAAARSDALLASETRVRSVLEAAPEPVVTLDARGMVSQANAATEEITGWSEDDIRGRPAIEVLVAPEYRADLARRFATMLGRPDGSGQARRVEAEVLCRDGRRLPVEMSVAVTTAARERLMHIFARDVSARAAAERATREHAADLERLLAIARSLSESADAAEARVAVVREARELTGAALAVLLEPDQSGRTLAYSATAGPTPPPVRLPVSGRSHSAAVYRTGRSDFVLDLRADTSTSRLLVEATNVVSGYWQPVRRGGATVGVLAVFWSEPRSDVAARLVSLLELFAAEAATAIERADVTSRLRDQSLRDPLTGTANRRGLDDTLTREVARAIRSATPLSVVMIDLDHFKSFNDEHGHPAGDALLKAAADAWRAELRTGDTLARFGGEEFVALLPNCDLTGAMKLAQRLLDVVPSEQTASAGVAQLNGGESGADLIARADTALYASKAAGRNRALAT